MPVENWEQWDGTLLQLVTRETTVRDAEQLVTRVRTGVLNGAIALYQARAILARGNLDPERINRYIAVWEIAGSFPTRPPTAAQIRAATGQPAIGRRRPVPEDAVLPAFPAAPQPAPVPAPVPAPTSQEPQATPAQTPAPQAQAPPVQEFPPFGGRG